MKISLRTKLTISFSAVVFFTGLISIIVGLHLVGEWIINRAQCEVAAGLNSAKEVYQSRVDCIATVTNLTAERFFIKDALLKDDFSKLGTEFKRIRSQKCPDIFTLTDEMGLVIFRSRNPDVFGDSQADDELVKEVLEKKKPVASTVIVPSEELIKEGKDLAERARITVIHTPKAKPSKKTEETSGMVMKAAAPVLDEEGNLIGVLYGGDLINRNYKVVDKVKDMVYRGVTYKGQEIGTATIFQKGLRIATNVRKDDGDRADGTLVSSDVYDRVFIKGKPWMGRAFVVNNWYLTAYEPIKNIKGENVGMLNVGLHERKFVDMKRQMMLMFTGIILAGIFLALTIVYFLAKSMTKPIKYLAERAEEISKGNFSQKVEVRSGDEIGDLEAAFGQMTKKISEAHDEYERTLEHKVSELQDAHSHMIRTEKLASLGMLAAGVAHELNNPLSSILTYCYYLRRKTDDDSIRERLDVMIKEITRCTGIVKNLLDFAGKEPEEEKAVDINEVLNRTLDLLKNQALFQNIEIKQQLESSIPEIVLPDGQIQQVFMNVLINAAEACSGHGLLNITTRKTNGHIEIEFRDNGCGISKEELGKIFDPFYSKKETGKGTGLGLAVSYGIINCCGGTIGVESEKGKGSTFKITLPLSTT